MKVKDFLKLSGKEKADYIVDSRAYRGHTDGIFFILYSEEYFYTVTVEFDNDDIGYLAEIQGYEVENIEEIYDYYFSNEYDIDKHFITENNDYINDEINYILDYEHDEKEEGDLYV